MPRTFDEIDPSTSKKPFSTFAKHIAAFAGHPMTFVLACVLIMGWALSGQFFAYSNTWQLIINTGTTIATFLMVFLLQNTQNRDSAAMQLKLDELIRSDNEAHNALLDLEELTDKELEALHKKYEDLAAKARGQLRKGKKDTGSPEIL